MAIPVGMGIFGSYLEGQESARRERLAGLSALSTAAGVGGQLQQQQQAAQMGPLQMQLLQAQIAAAQRPQGFAKVDPKDYTPESITKFSQTNNYSDLVPVRKRESITTTGLQGEPVTQMIDPYNPPATMFPQPVRNEMVNTGNQVVPVNPYGRPSPLNIGMNPFQSATLGLQGQKNWWETGLPNPYMGGGPQPGPAPGPQPFAPPGPGPMPGPQPTPGLPPKATAERAADEAKRRDDTGRAVNAYSAARDGLLSALDNTVTGPFLGRTFALSSEQQIASGAVSAMAPVLKQLFRVSGEGVFTDRDQELLLNMVPDRSDRPDAATAKMENIDRIVAEKTGLPVPKRRKAGKTQSTPSSITEQADRILGL